MPYSYFIGGTRARPICSLLNPIMKGYVKWDVEMTDTFGGEANGSWVRRGTTLVREGASRLAIVRAVKRELGITGTRCRVTDHGDMLELKPYGFCTVAFATVQY